MKQIYNFSAGPATLPKSVLQKATQELTNYKNTGISVMEMSHRSLEFTEIIESANFLLRKLMGIPEDYDILFLQGGASLQFSMVPLNLMKQYQKADYVNTGVWSQKAIQEAKKYGDIHIPSSSEKDGFTTLPNLATSQFRNETDYIHITTNNTIYGTCYHDVPKLHAPLVADMSSNILAQEYDITKFSLIYAGAQKNIGPAGVTIVIIKKDVIGYAKETTPALLNYKTQSDAHSLYNTPSCYSIYISKLVLEWIEEQGGVMEMQKRSVEKSNFVYEFLDQSTFFKPTIQNSAFRSLTNITFLTPSKELDMKFVTKATHQGLIGLKGHRLVGGIRASLYNAMPLEGVKALIEFMEHFQKTESI